MENTFSYLSLRCALELWYCIILAQGQRHRMMITETWSSNILTKILFIYLCVGETETQTDTDRQEYMCHWHTCRVQKTTHLADSFFPQCRTQGLNSSHQPWRQAPLPTEPCCWPRQLIFDQATKAIEKIQVFFNKALNIGYPYEWIKPDTNEYILHHPISIF